MAKLPLFFFFFAGFLIEPIKTKDCLVDVMQCGCITGVFTVKQSPFSNESPSRWLRETFRDEVMFQSVTYFPSRSLMDQLMFPWKSQNKKQWNYWFGFKCLLEISLHHRFLTFLIRKCHIWYIKNETFGLKKIIFSYEQYLLWSFCRSAPFIV